MSALKSSLMSLLTTHDTAGSGAGWYCEDEGTPEDEQIGLEVPSQAARCQTCSNHVNEHASRKVALAC